MLSRLGPALLALLACCACGANPADKQSATARAVLAPPPPVALAAHADADHAIAAGGLQDLDKTTDRLLSTLEALPDTQRLEAETLISRPKLVEWFGFDPTKRAGWDDIGVDAAAGVFFVLDDRWPKTETTTRQIVVFVHLSQVEHWKALLTRKGAVFSQDGAVEVCEISRTTMWLTRAGEDFALTQAVAPDVPEAKAAAMEAFLAIAKTPVAPLDKAPSWKLAVHDAGRPWLAMWARTADLGAKADVDPLAFIAHCTSLFPQLAWWMGDGWAVRVTTLPLAQQGLREMFVPEKPAPACAGLIPAEGWVVSVSVINISARFKVLAISLVMYLIRSGGWQCAQVKTDKS